MMATFQRVLCSAFLAWSLALLCSSCGKEAEEVSRARLDVGLTLQRQLDRLAADRPHLAVEPFMPPGERPGEAVIIVRGIENHAEAQAVFVSLMAPWSAFVVEYEEMNLGWTRADPFVESLQAFWYWDDDVEESAMYIYIALP